VTIEEILATGKLDRSVLIGYYGGGNYGDELLLEVLANRLKSNNVQDVFITYQDPALYTTYHHDFGYPLIKMGDKPKLLRTIIKNKNIIIGGGGLWGLDVNPNILLLSLLLFISKWLLGKKVYLLGVGYYGSTSWYGRVSAWLAGKSATYIVARDPETYANFKKINRRVSLDTDIAWLIPKIDSEHYERDLSRLESALPIASKTLFITLRRFKPKQKNDYIRLVGQYLKTNQGPVIIALMEPQSVDPAGYEIIQTWQQNHPNIRIIDFSYNPMALFLFFQKYHDRLALIGPQFHMIITAHLNDVPFLPIAYDNKVSELLKQLKQPVMPIGDISQPAIQAFAGSFYKGEF
jgi:polysaccharide pyruvyl transferase WcaK-like protein